MGVSHPSHGDIVVDWLTNRRPLSNVTTETTHAAFRWWGETPHVRAATDFIPLSLCDSAAATP